MYRFSCYIIVVTFTSVINSVWEQTQPPLGTQASEAGGEDRSAQADQEQLLMERTGLGLIRGDFRRVYRVSGNLGSQSAEGQLKEVLI